MSEKILGTIKKHEKLIELAKKLNHYGKITEVIFTMISQFIHNDEKVLFCYYETQTGNKYLENGSVIPQLSSCELNILTTKNYLNFSFFQNSHSINIKKVDNISEMSFKKIFGSKYDIEEEIGAEERNFVPTQIQFSMSLNNEKNEKVAELVIDTMNQENINLIMTQIDNLSTYIGLSLSKV
jgi:hypothetical protein